MSGISPITGFDTALPSNYLLELPPGFVEGVVCILDDAIDQLGILGDISKDHERRGGNESGGAQLARDALMHSKRQQGRSGYAQGNQASSGAVSAHSHAHVVDPSKVSRERVALQQLLAQAVEELRRLPKAYVGSLARAVEEEKTRRNQVPDAQAKEREAVALLKKAQKALAEEQKTRERDRKDRDRVIQQLREATQEIVALTASEQKYLKKETRAHEAQAKSVYAHAEKKLASSKEAISRELEMEQRCHQAVVDYLNRQRLLLEKSIQEWMNRHEEDTEMKVAELEALKASRAADVDHFEELLAKYEELEKTVDEEKARRARELEERRVAWAETMRARAAKKIQAWYRQCHRKKRGDTADKKGSARKGGSAKRKSASAGKKKSKK